MILSNAELFKAIDEGRPVIDPPPGPRYPEINGPESPFNTHSVDLRLGDEISIPNPGAFVVDHTLGANLPDHISRNSRKLRITEDQPYKLMRDSFVLGITLESVGLPIGLGCETCLAARIEGKSSRARVGLLIHFTAPTVHPGWNGPLVLEMINLGPSPILLTPGMYIAQLIVEELKGCPVEAEPSQFQGQQHPDGTASQKIP